MYVYIYMTTDLVYSYVSPSWNTSNMKLDKQQKEHDPAIKIWAYVSRIYFWLHNPIVIWISSMVRAT